MLIKICGLTNAETAYQTALAGADLIGLLFSDCSPRKISLELAVQISQQARLGGAEIVGVFVDETYQEMLHIITTLKLKYVQLHGAKVYPYGNKLDKDIHIIYLVNNQPLPEYLSVKRDFLLFDKTVPVATNFRFLVAGNLSCDNVASKVTQYDPDGVDVSSALESSLAIKDINKIRQFIELARPERYGRFGGRFIAELLVAPLKQLEEGYNL
jgi:phosphoribosylanthranilate isomerase